MIRILGTIFAGLLGLAFGSFLNVCLTRWPQGESIVRPRSHCRNCDHMLAWWENIPLLSWLALRGRCRKCHAWIVWRYAVVEFSIAALWVVAALPFIETVFYVEAMQIDIQVTFTDDIGMMIFYWILVALAVLDAENLWLPDSITLTGCVLGFLFGLTKSALMVTDRANEGVETMGHAIGHTALSRTFSMLIAAALILLIRWLYWLIRRREGIGLGDAKLLALLAAWLGLPGALLALGLGVVLGAVVALVQLAIPSARNQSESLAMNKLPLGTFLCIGGIVSSLWGQSILNAYLRWSGL